MTRTNPDNAAAEFLIGIMLREKGWCNPIIGISGIVTVHCDYRNAVILQIILIRLIILAIADFLGADHGRIFLETAVFLQNDHIISRQLCLKILHCAELIDGCIQVLFCPNRLILLIVALQKRVCHALLIQSIQEQRMQILFLIRIICSVPGNFIVPVGDLSRRIRSCILILASGNIVRKFVQHHAALCAVCIDKPVHIGRFIVGNAVFFQHFLFFQTGQHFFRLLLLCFRIGALEFFGRNPFLQIRVYRFHLAELCRVVFRLLICFLGISTVTAGIVPDIPAACTGNEHQKQCQNQKDHPNMGFFLLGRSRRRYRILPVPIVISGGTAAFRTELCCIAQICPTSFTKHPFSLVSYTISQKRHDEAAMPLFLF